MNKPKGTAVAIYNDTTEKFYKDEDEFRSEQTQLPDAIPTTHPSPMKCTVSVIQARRNPAQGSLRRLHL